VIAADAGPMQIQLREGAILRGAEAVMADGSHHAERPEIG